MRARVVHQLVYIIEHLSAVKCRGLVPKLSTQAVVFGDEFM